MHKDGCDAALLARLTRLQAQLAGLWSEWAADLSDHLANDWAMRFSETSLQGAQAALSEGVWRCYDEWIECAEQAYARMVRQDRFCRLQADIVNALLALALEQPGTAAMMRGLHQARHATAGCTVRQRVFDVGKATLYRYFPLPFTRAARSRPLLICYALVNRPTVLDFSPERSWVRRLLAAGFDVHVIDWSDPAGGDCGLTLEDYIERYLGGCVRFLLDSCAVDSVDLLGICQGGTFSLCYTALHPRHVRNLVTVSTPLDFQTPDDLLSKWVHRVDVDLLERAGNVSAEVLNALFFSLMPFRIGLGKYFALLRRAHEPRVVEDFVRLENWRSEGPAQAALALAQFVKWFYQENRLLRGTLELSGRRVSLGRIRQPLLNVFGTRDHIVPAKASMSMQHHIGSTDYCEHAVDAGHVGMYVSRRVAHSASARIVEWLCQRR